MELTQQVGQDFKENGIIYFMAMRLVIISTRTVLRRSWAIFCERTCKEM